MKTNKKTGLLILFISGSQLLFTACDDGMPDYYNQRDYELQNFTGVNLGDALEVEIVKADEFKVIAKGEDKDINDLELRVEAGILTGNYRPGSRNHKRTQVQIYLPELEKADMHSATTTTIKGFFNEDDSLKLKVSSASKVTMDSELKFLELELSAASKAILSGEVKTMQTEVSGASELKAGNFSAGSCRAEVKGTSKATVKVTDHLTAKVNGASELKYTGSPDYIEKEVTSDSRISSF